MGAMVAGRVILTRFATNLMYDLFRFAACCSQWLIPCLFGRLVGRRALCQGVIGLAASFAADAV
jgi:hypothetical protein